MSSDIMSLLYLHGFNSDGAGWKSAALARHFPGRLLLAPDLPPDPAAVVSTLEALMAEAPAPVYVFGSSLGGFYAYYLSARYGCPAFLFNPSMQPHLTLHRGIGAWETYLKKRPYVFEAAYLDTLATLAGEADALADPALLHFFLATDDDILDHSALPARFPNAASLRWYDRCGHRFDKFERALKEIKQAGWI